MNDHFHHYLYAFYDPPSRRMKVAHIAHEIDEAGHISREMFVHRGRSFRIRDPLLYIEVEMVYSKDDKVIGFGLAHLNVEGCFESVIGAVNAVVDGHRNHVCQNDIFCLLNKQRRSGGNTIDVIYWWLTETWEEFESQVAIPKDGSLNDPLDYYLMGGQCIYVMMERCNPDYDYPDGKKGNCMIEFDNNQGKPLGFKLATENIPQCIPIHKT